ncbi:hypothetical protein N825_25105 [Skermanella stibiiresistens SB22]|uniref:DUF2161 domain-containing phosphodiesterase n=1 Tax=Skermanella stibiiresistens SB22 TaxID=1385369 RepID=W9HAS5_9PROT|nr:DUF2161 family putative PD-(D/E)XK-type phosphodiesterase [Skermanella stibiiresistens]EWY41797.1 hypothetical protein N825_25105 [Skermanella stibiiresistens SB22]
MPITSEVDLYDPVKAFLEAQGYDVKGEVRSCDLVAVRAGEAPVLVELKLRFSLSLVLQGIDRLALSDRVYLAVPKPSGRRISGPNANDATVRKLCRMLGMGLLTVDPAARKGFQVDVVVEPAPYRPRINAKRARLLLKEHERRLGDPNRGGSSKVKIVTAYRQEALRCATLLRINGPMAVAALRRDGDAPNAAGILQRNVYGWFERVSRGKYRLTEEGARGLERFAPEEVAVEITTS